MLKFICFISSFLLICYLVISGKCHQVLVGDVMLARCQQVLDCGSIIIGCQTDLTIRLFTKQ